MGTDLARILLIDDEPKVAESLDDLANQYDFHIVYHQFLENGLIELKKNYENYVGLIIDGKGQINEASRQDDESHITFAVSELAKLEQKGIIVPWVIYTAYFDRYVIDFRHLSERIFKKNRDETELLKYFIKIRDNSISYKIRNKFYDTCEILDRGILDEEVKHKLLKILSIVVEKNIKEFSFNDVRQVFEAVLLKLNEVGILPQLFIKGSRPNLEWSFRFLSGLQVDIKGPQNTIIKSFPPNNLPIFPPHISKIFEGVKNISSIWSHEYNEPYTDNTHKFVVYGIIEIIFWLDNYLNNNNLIHN
jgi:hypothetical protein